MPDDDTAGQDGPEPLPATLERGTESLTLQRGRAEVRPINSRYWRL
ncbi:hypothetical protein PUR71_02740 [Streptomyces sp. SP17BM10]|nr:hypothetical protein [Streptomyces sp. SP17BM10]MEE1781855.1 hypothetical protein [Streptomyces sp. SP17BM10]